MTVIGHDSAAVRADWTGQQTPEPAGPVNPAQYVPVGGVTLSLSLSISKNTGVSVKCSLSYYIQILTIITTPSFGRWLSLN